MKRITGRIFGGEGDRADPIDPAGQVNGVLITAAHVTVRGFTVTRAAGEGILVNSADYATIEGNVATDNDLGAAVDPCRPATPSASPQDRFRRLR